MVYTIHIIYNNVIKNGHSAVCIHLWPVKVLWLLKIDVIIRIQDILIFLASFKGI